MVEWDPIMRRSGFTATFIREPLLQFSGPISKVVLINFRFSVGYCTVSVSKGYPSSICEGLFRIGNGLEEGEGSANVVSDLLKSLTEAPYTGLLVE
jgi:hypothetical protein